MASKVILLATLVAAAQASGLSYSGQYGYAAGHLGTYFTNLGYSGGHLRYAAPLSYANQYTSYADHPIAKTYPASFITKSYTAPIAHTYTAPIFTKAYAAPVVHNAVVKTVAKEPTASEYSTFVKTAPAFENTLDGYSGYLGYAAPLSYAKHYTSYAAPIAKTYAAPLITKAYNAPIAHTYAAPIVTKAPVAHAVPVVKTFSEEPTVSEYAISTKSAPGIHRTLVHPQAPIVQERINHVVREKITPVVHERIAAPALNYAAPALNYAAPALTYAAPALSYAAPAW
ncbi:unnamed protein product [Brassicogethes aeneus]|uniref:Cuticle protein n=1 Tax=Brassicogethes aeneus TaxID=1431903 RepID=A0A9P0AZF7_BRAAE|nr:unnamed protein product [Brassicogethes aeneus]